MSRTPLGRNFGIGTRELVYESDDAIEVESSDHYELSRKRVLFEDIALITYHREFGWAFLSANIFVAVIFLAIAEVTYAGGGGWIAAAIISAFAVPSIIAIFLRLTYRVDVISIFGKRSRATVRFSFKKQKAREIYGRLCHRTRQVQKNIEESNRLIAEAEKPPIEPAIDPSLLPPPIEEQESTG
jgi:hypothetical protein